jgi:hypothetical protein
VVERKQKDSRDGMRGNSGTFPKYGIGRMVAINNSVNKNGVVKKII